MEIIECTLDDIKLLAELNKELFEDENNDNIPPVDVLEERLRFAILNGSKGFLFMDNCEILGYALVKIQPPSYYLSHFLICRNMRRKRLGTIAFNQLMDKLNTDTIDLDVFCWNQRGQEFWKSLGFKERCIIMRKSK